MFLSIVTSFCGTTISILFKIPNNIEITDKKMMLAGISKSSLPVQTETNIGAYLHSVMARQPKSFTVRCSRFTFTGNHPNHPVILHTHSW